MNGTATETVASSWMEALGGVSMCWMRKVPPLFCAHPVPFAHPISVAAMQLEMKRVLSTFIASSRRCLAVDAFGLRCIAVRLKA
jgi:C4-dicarboxylate-specific signal transduction histidine kinase